MKYKKAIAGVLAAAMVITSFVSTPVSVFAADTQINVSKIQYTAPAVAAQPQPASVVIDQHHTEVKDRADTPATMEAVDGSTAEIKQEANVWGFCQQLKSTGDTAAKLNASRSVQILVSFRLYLSAYPTDGNVSILSKGDQYGVELTTNGLRLYLQNEQGQTRQVVYNNCFTGGLHRWYDVAAVIDARNAGKSRIYVNGAASEMQEHRNISSTEDPFAIACKIKGSTVSEKFTKDNGYLADLKFYNSSALSKDDQEIFRRLLNLNWMNNRADKGWSVIQDLLSSVKPTADFTLKPYDISTVWTTEEDAETKSVENDFQCGYPYTATTTLKAHEGFSFEGNTQDSISVVDGYDYTKVELTESCGVADSQDAVGETGQPDRGAAKYAVDGDTATYWHTRYSQNEGGNNVNFANNQNNGYTITLPEKKTVGKFEYWPRQNGKLNNGTILKYNLFYKANSSDANWTPLVEEGVWDRDTKKKSISFDPVEASQIRIEVKEAVSEDGSDYINAAEFEVYEAAPKTSATKTVTVSEDKKILTITAEYSAIECTATINYVAFPAGVTMEKETPYTIAPSVYASDSRPVSAHKELLEQSKKIVYAYTVKSGSDVITVDNTTGVITAKQVGEAVVTATAKLPAEGSSEERDLGSRDIQVTVLAENKKLQAPVITFKAPEENAYPAIAEAGVQRTDLENQMLVDTVPGGATLDLVEGADDPVFRCIDNITGFVGRYQASMTDQQFNVTGSNPMVITLKLYLKALPTVEGREYTVVSKGNQYNFVVMKRNGNPILRFQTSGGNWAAWGYPIDSSFLNKWHDIVIVADGKGNANSVGFFVDGEYCNNKIQGSGIPEIPESDNGTGGGTLRPFAICDKRQESNPMEFTEDNGYIARLRFHNINQMDPLGQKGLAEKINIDTLGTEHAAEVIQLLLDAEQPTARITATPYAIKTTWNVRNEKNEETPLDAGKPFTNKDIVRNGYSVQTEFEAFDGFAFDTALTDEDIIKNIKISLPDGTLLSAPFENDLYRCEVAHGEYGRRLTVKVTFLPCEIPPQDFTYASPASGRTSREKPRYDAETVEKYMTVANTKWKKVTKAGDGTETETEIAADAEFEQITENSWYRAESELTAKGVYLFGRDYTDVPDGQKYSDRVKAAIKTQVFGNVEAEKTLTIKDDNTTMTIRLDYKKPIYQVTFDTDGGTGTYEPQSVSQGNTAVEPENAPVKEGYTFDGWYASEDAAAAYDFKTPVTADVSLKAKYHETHTVTFHPELEGVENIVKETDNEGKVAEHHLPSQKDFTFAGWFEKNANGSWKDTAFDFDQKVTANTDLYAKWTVTVTFKDSEEVDAAVIKTATIEKGKTLGTDDKPENPTKNGYDFKWWYSKDNDTETKYEDTTTFAKHTVLYAKWEAKSYTVTLNIGSGASWPEGYQPPTSITHDTVLSITQTPKQEGKHFAGWYTDENCTQRYDFAPAQGDITLYAKWADAVYEVTYNKNTDDENASVNPASVFVEVPAEGGKTTVAVPPQAFREHYEVEGWYTEAACENKFTFGEDGTPVTADITLYAKWQKKQYTVTFNTNGGSAVDAKTVEAEATIAEAPESTKDGFRLEGWYRDAALTVKFVFGTDQVTRDITLYAKWIVPVTSITITPSSVTVDVGEDPVWLKAVVQPENADQNVTWTSDHPEIATVAEDGMVTAVSEGTATITAAADGRTATATVTVTDNLPAEKIYKMSAEQDFGIKSWGTDKGTSYTNRKILVVRNEHYNDKTYGGVGEGMLADGRAGSDSSLSLLQFDLSKITRKQKNMIKTAETAVLRLCLAGARNQSADNRLTAAVVPAESGLTDISGKTTWNAVNAAVTGWVSESANRFVTAGTSDPYTSDGGKDMNSAAPLNPAVYVSIDIKDALKNAVDASNRKLILAINETKGAEQYFVRTAGAVGDSKFQNATEDMAPAILLSYPGEAAETVAVTPKTTTLTSVDETVQLSAAVGPETAKDKTVTWTSSNPSVATVDGNGLVTAVSNGTVEITAKANGAKAGEEVKDTATIDVAIPCSCEIGKVTVSGGTTVLIKADENEGTLQLGALAAAKDGTCQITGHPDNNAVSYQYAVNEEEENTAEATVSAAGLVTAAKAGKVTITVTATLADGAEGKKTATENVTITARKLSENERAVEYNANTNGHDAEVTGMPESEVVTVGTKLQEPAAPSWTGHTFGGWSITADGAAVTWPYEITEHTVFYAVWGTSGSITEKEAKEALEEALRNAKAIYEGFNIYTDPTWDEFRQAYEEASGSLTGKTPQQIKALADLLNLKRTALSIDTDKKAWADAKTAFDQALSQAGKLIATGGSGYETASWNAFKKAYDEAYAKKDAQMGSITEAELKTLTAALNKAKGSLRPIGLKNGDATEKDGVRYVVTNAAAKTVSAEGVASQKKNLKKAVILSTVSIKGVACTVTEIKAKGFKKFTKLSSVSIGSSVQTVGKQAFNGCKKLKKITFQCTKVPTFKGKTFKGTSPKAKVKLSKALKKGKTKRTMIKKLRKAGISKKAKIK